MSLCVWLPGRETQCPHSPFGAWFFEAGIFLSSLKKVLNRPEVKNIGICSKFVALLYAALGNENELLLVWNASCRL